MIGFFLAGGRGFGGFRDVYVGLMIDEVCIYVDLMMYDGWIDGWIDSHESVNNKQTNNRKRLWLMSCCHLLKKFR